MQRILIINSKGGCGKTTITTNLACAYASQGFKTALIDHDPQGSSMRWLKLRPTDRPEISGVNAHKRQAGNQTLAFHLRVPHDVERVVIDAPAGVTGPQLRELVKTVDTIIIPVLPSPIDIHSATYFIKDLLLLGNVRQNGVRIGVVANRTRKQTRVYKSLELFLNSLNLPFIGSIRDTQNYVHAFERGVGVHEMWDKRVEQDRTHWIPIINWLEKNANLQAVLHRNSS